MSRAWAVSIIAVALSQVAVVATSIYLHRTLAHGALRLHPAADLLFRAILFGVRGAEFDPSWAIRALAAMRLLVIVGRPVAWARASQARAAPLGRVPTRTAG